MVSHILLDFFGTLVAYSPSRTEQGFARTHALVRSFGADLTYGELTLAVLLLIDRLRLRQSG